MVVTLAVFQSLMDGGGARAPPPPHLAPAALARQGAEGAGGLAGGSPVRASFRVNARNATEGYCPVPELPADVLVRGPARQNRAVHGDVVALHLDPPTEWPAETLGGRGGQLGPPGPPPPSLSGLSLEEAAGGGGATELQRWGRHAEARGLRPTGRVVAVLEPSPRRACMVGFLERGPVGGGALELAPLDARLPRCRVLPRRGSGPHLPAAPSGTLVVSASLEAWRPEDRLPDARVTGVLGDARQMGVQARAILHQEGLSATHPPDFPADALACLPPSGLWEPSEADLAGRRDLRPWRVFSIDPPTARDLDDALSFERLAPGRLRVGVHIADVSHFVGEGTALDAEASRRSTSVYLVGEVLPMLPRRLCEQLCSLQPGEPRLAFSVVWEVDEATGDIRDEWMGRSVIRSCGQLHYAHAQHVIELPPGRAAELPEGAELAPDSPHSRRDVAEDIRALHGVAHKLRARRFAEGSLRLNNPKLSFRCDPHGHPLEAAVYVQREANELVEEFMLLANRRVAAVIAEACPGLAVLRNHPPPDRRKTAEVEALVARMGLPGTFCTSSSGVFQESLRRLADSAPLEVSSAVTLLSTKPMHLAQYFCTGSEAFAGNKALWRHYALAFDRYTHFTSPIRRYPDVLVHRTLAGVLGPDGRPRPRSSPAPAPEALARVEACCKHSNEQKLAARNAQDGSLRLNLSWLLKDRPMDVPAIVVGAGGNKWFDVFVHELGVEARVLIEDMVGVRAWFRDGALGLTAAGSPPNDKPGQPRRKVKDNPYGYAVDGALLPLVLRLLSPLRVRLYGREVDSGRRVDVAARLLSAP